MRPAKRRRALLHEPRKFITSSIIGGSSNWVGVYRLIIDDHSRMLRQKGRLRNPRLSSASPQSSSTQTNAHPTHVRACERSALDPNPLLGCHIHTSCRAIGRLIP